MLGLKKVVVSFLVSSFLFIAPTKKAEAVDGTALGVCGLAIVIGSGIIIGGKHILTRVIGKKYYIESEALEKSSSTKAKDLEDSEFLDLIINSLRVEDISYSDNGQVPYPNYVLTSKYSGNLIPKTYNYSSTKDGTPFYVYRKGKNNPIGTVRWRLLGSAENLKIEVSVRIHKTSGEASSVFESSGGKESSAYSDFEILI